MDSSSKLHRNAIVIISILALLIMMISMIDIAFVDDTILRFMTSVPAMVIYGIFLFVSGIVIFILGMNISSRYDSFLFLIGLSMLCSTLIYAIVLERQFKECQTDYVKGNFDDVGAVFEVNKCRYKDSLIDSFEDYVFDIKEIKLHQLEEFDFIGTRIKQ